MPRIIDPRRRCLDLKDWPEPDRQAWEAAMRGRRGRFAARGLAARLSAAAHRKGIRRLRPLARLPPLPRLARP